MKNKRLFSFLLALCMLVSLIPAGAVTAYASENEPAVISVDVPYQVNPVYADIIDVDENEYYASSSPIKTYGTVTYVSESEAVKQLRQAMVNRETSVQINYTTSNANINQSLHEVFDAAIAHTGNPVEGDYLKFTYGGHESHARAYPGDMAKVEATYTISYYTTASQEAALDVEVTKLLDQLDLYDSSDYQKLRGIYEYITKNIRYDYDNLNDNSYHLKHTAYAALMNKTAVCQGYANLFYRLALTLDVDARIIAGDGVVANTAGPHAWNIAKLGNKYYNLDATWDEGQTKYNWFLLSPASFADHYRYEDYNTTAFNSAYPMSTTNYQVPALAIMTQPTNKTVTAGEKATFSVAATGDGLTYQWQYKSPSGTSWASTTFSGNKTATLTVTTQEKYDGYQYRCVITDGTNTVTSNAATLTVKAAAPALAITTQPTNKTVTAGEKATFSVAATGDGLTYQWQYKSPSGTSWASTTFSGNKTATLTVTTQEKHDGYQYRCKVTDGTTTVYSNAATLTVKAAAPALAITTQPTNKTVTAGEKAKFSVVATGENLSYQWQYKSPSGTKWASTTFTGAKTATLTVTTQEKYDGYQYRCVITDGTNTVTSNAATLTVKAAAPALAITTQPANKTVTAGEKAKFSVVATGENLSYQWQYKSPSGTKWASTTFTGAKTATLTVSAQAKYDGYQYRCKITDGTNTVYSNAATLTVKTASTGVSITTQPTDKTVTAGEKAKFSVVATGENLTYQWQYKSPSGTKWASTTFTGAKTATLTVSAQVKYDGYQYRCKITDGTNTVYSNAATLTVKTASTGVSITTQPANKTVAAGEKAKFTVAATGDGLTYQWQYKSPSGTKWASTTFTGAKTATLTVSAQAKYDGYQYRCKITDGTNTVYSNAATLTVKSSTTKLAITTQPANKTVTAGEKAKFSVVATGDGLSYQWQYKSPSGTKWASTTFTGAKTATLTVSAQAKYDGYQYRCKITDGTNTVYSNAATLTVKSSTTKLAITTQPADKTVSAGSKVTFKVVASGSNLSYQWQYKSPSMTNWETSTLTGAKTATLTVGAQTYRSGYQYRCKISNGTTTIYSEPATLTVGTGLSITTQPTNKTATAGSKVTFKVVASGSNLTYQWQYKSPSMTNWETSTLTGAKTATLTVGAQTYRSGYQYRCKITSGTTTVTSNAVTLTVQ